MKAHTKEHILKIGAPGFMSPRIQDQELLTIKLEIDTQPSEGYILQTQELLQPMPFWVRTLSLSCLFAGKVHAVLCRDWGNPVKGRDWYDMLWFIQKRTLLQLSYLESKMRQTAHYTSRNPLEIETLMSFLYAKIERLDIERAKEDVIRFVQKQEVIEGLTKNIFIAAVKKITESVPVTVSRT